MDQKVVARGAHRGTLITNRLTELKIKRAAKPGRYADGACLYFEVSKAGTKHWIFSYERDGQRRELGLGGYPNVSLLEARGKAPARRV
jgi:Arm DNA-binding domain